MRGLDAIEEIDDKMRLFCEDNCKGYQESHMCYGRCKEYLEIKKKLKKEYE